MAIPFKYGTIVSGKDFCGRKALLEQIIGHMESAQRVAVLGERRVGKSSLVYEAVRKWKGAKLLYVDLMGIKSVDALCRRLLRAVIMLEKGASWFDKMVKKLAHLRPSISVDPITAMPTVTFDAAMEFETNSIPEALDVVESISKKDRVVVVLDEFQDVLNVEDPQEALALLRGKIQFQNAIPYVFVGSIRHSMDAIFTHHDSAFFKSAIPLTVEPIPYDEFSRFLKRKFGLGQRAIGNDVLEKVFEVANNIPGDIQQLCEAMWEVTSEQETISAGTLGDALTLIFAREQKSYEHYVSMLTNLQQKCLKAVARAGGRNVFSAFFMKSAGFTNASSIRRSLERLVKVNILFETQGEYRFLNPFFRAWLLQKG